MSRPKENKKKKSKNRQYVEDLIDTENVPKKRMSMKDYRMRKLLSSGINDALFSTNSDNFGADKVSLNVASTSSAHEQIAELDVEVDLPTNMLEEPNIILENLDIVTGAMDSNKASNSAICQQQCTEKCDLRYIYFNGRDQQICKNVAHNFLTVCLSDLDFVSLPIELSSELKRIGANFDTTYKLQSQEPYEIDSLCCCAKRHGQAKETLSPPNAQKNVTTPSVLESQNTYTFVKNPDNTLQMVSIAPHVTYANNQASVGTSNLNSALHSHQVIYNQALPIAGQASSNGFQTMANEMSFSNFIENIAAYDPDKPLTVSNQSNQVVVLTQQENDE